MVGELCDVWPLHYGHRTCLDVMTQTKQQHCYGTERRLKERRRLGVQR